MNRKGFTLVELLIVIAIIGILAAVMIPMLLSARITANKRAIQSHSANVLKVLTAILAEDQYINVSQLATSGQSNCLNAVSSITVGSKSYNYGWSNPPQAASICNVTVNAADNSLLVVLQGNALAQNYQSTNGQ